MKLLHGGLGSRVDFTPPLLGGLPPNLRLIGIGIGFRGHGRSTLGAQALT